MMVRFGKPKAGNLPGNRNLPGSRSDSIDSKLKNGKHRTCA